MNRVLFVDDEPRILEGLEALLRKHRRAWSMSFAHGGEAALGFLAERDFDVVVTDLRMPKVDGMQLLMHLLARHPRTMRVVLSGESEKDPALAFSPYAHQSLVKPCRVEEIDAVLERACLVKGLVSDPHLADVLGSVRELPPLPQTFAKLRAALDDPNGGLRAVADVVASDIALSAKLLKLTNSAFFGLGRKVSSVGEAIPLLGAETVKSLALSTALFDLATVPSHVRALATTLHEHSLAVASLAKSLATEEQSSQAFAAGLLHDVGRMVIGVELPEVGEAATASDRSSAVDARPDSTHARLGAYLFALWGLPLAVVETVAGHHDGLATDNPLSAPVYAAEAILSHVCGERAPSGKDLERVERLAGAIRPMSPPERLRALASLETRPDFEVRRTA